MSHPDDSYIPSPIYEGPVPADLSSAHVQHDDEVWSDSGEWICVAANFETARLIAAMLRTHAIPGEATCAPAETCPSGEGKPTP